MKLAAALLLLAIHSPLFACVDDSDNTNVPETLEQRVSNKDGSTLILETKECSTDLTLRAHGSIHPLLHLRGGSGYSRLADIDEDGMFEFEFVTGCGTVNCGADIYQIDLSSLKARKLLSYNGFNLEKMGSYLVSSERTAGYGEYQFNAYRIANFHKAKTQIKPAVEAHNYYDEKNKYNICEISVKPLYRNSEIVRKLIKLCLPGSKVKMGARDL